MLTTGARLPGFYHTKGEPFRVRLIETNDVAPYTDEQIIEAFPPIDKVTRPPSSIGIILTSRSPVEAAKLFASKFTREGEALPALVHHRGDIYKWNGRHYTPFGEYNLTEELYEFLSQIWIAKTNQQGVTQHEPFNPSRSKVGEVRDALAAGVNQDEHCHPPFYYGKGPSGINLVVDGSQEIAARNGLLNLTTRKFEPHSQFFFTTSSLPFAYDKNAPKPVEWYRFLRQLWPTNKVARRCLQEIFGLALTTDTSFQKLFLIVGPKRSGKGTIGRVLREMLSSAAVAAPTLKSLSGDFGLQSLINKRMAIISDARLGSGDASVTSR
jgi:putative DNA primase/helicase